jgi:hypothetical protein
LPRLRDWPGLSAILCALQFPRVRRMQPANGFVATALLFCLFVATAAADPDDGRHRRHH